MENKSYLQFAREHCSRQLKQRALAKKERLQKEAEQEAALEMACSTK